MTFAVQQDIDRLAVRIHRAYLRRGARWNDGCSTTRVWTAAAMVLIQCRRHDAAIPTDPELFVAAQPIDPDFADPWIDLASPRAGERFRQKVGQIVSRLRRELEGELRRAQALMRSGATVEEVLAGRNPGISPLGRYIVAVRASRFDLAEGWNQEAFRQHQSCPLYRNAAQEYLSPEEYPHEIELSVACGPSSYSITASLN